PHHAGAQSKALALSWKGYADTDLNFSEFYYRDHTIALRFMAQFPNAYEGPLVAESGSGLFMIAQGDYNSATAGTKLLLAVGSKTQTYPISFPSGPITVGLKPGWWYHLAVVATTSGTQRLFTPYLNAPLGSPLSVSSTDPSRPVGTVRFGK